MKMADVNTKAVDTCLGLAPFAGRLRALARPAMARL